MFGFGKHKQTPDKQKKSKKRLQASCDGGVTKSSKGQSERSAKIRAQALANAQAARQQIGEDTLNKIAEAMTKKQQSATEQAKAQIKDSDPDRVLDELKFLLDMNSRA